MVGAHPRAAGATARRFAGRVRTGHRVTAVGRARLTRRDLPGHPLRGERPFRLLVEGPRGEERDRVADYVLDASGVYGQPAALGAGGIPAPGERGLNGADHPRPRRARRPPATTWAGAKCCSSATATPRPTRSTPSRRCPSRRGSPGRRAPRTAGPASRWRTTRCPSASASRRGPTPWPRRRRRSCASCAARAWRDRGSDGRLDGRARPARPRCVSTRWSASPAIGRTCRSSPSWPSRSRPRARARRASRAWWAMPTDCLSAPAVTVRRPGQSGEPGFHLVGAKSYGRLPTFLMQTGIGAGGGDRGRRWARRERQPRRVPDLYPESPLLALDTLWLQVAGTLCNLQCTHCFISCSPDNHCARDDDAGRGAARTSRTRPRSACASTTSPAASRS